MWKWRVRNICKALVGLHTGTDIDNHVESILVTLSLYLNYFQIKYISNKSASK